MKYGWFRFLVALMLLMVTACGQQVATAPTPANIEMSVQVEPQPPAVGASTLIVTLQDGNGSAVNGASLQIHGDMDHAGMEPVDRQVNESVNGVYRVPFEWTMGGGWIVTVTAKLPDNGGEISKTFEFFVEAVSSDSVINRHGAEAAPESSMDAVNIAYAPDRNPAVGGDATVTVTLSDAAGAPITDAAVEVVGNMAHAGMMPVSGKGKHAGNGQYVVPLLWTMTGDWQVTVKVTLADGRQFEQTFDQQVVQS